MKKKNRIRHSNRPLLRIMRAVQVCFKVCMGIGCILGVSAAFIFAYDVLTQSDYFNIKQIDIQGAQRLSKKKICDHAHIKKGMNSFSINLSLAKKRLLNHPWVAEAKIDLKPPSGIEITLKEHRPLAFINLDRMYILNQQGVIFKERSTIDLFQLPVIQGLNFSDVYIPGKPRSRPFQAVIEILAIGKKLGNTLPDHKIDRIQVDREMGLTLYASKSQMAVRLGYSGYSDKYARLKKVLSHLRKRSDYSGVQFIDLNNEKRIVMKPIKTKENRDGKKEV